MWTYGSSSMARLLSASVDGHRDRLRPRECEQPLEALLAAVARELPAAERQLDAAAGAITVDEHLSAANRARHPQLPRAVARPHAGHEPEGRAIREPDRIGLIGKGHCSKHRAEHFVARETALR
jgi:hypothetical protein